MEKASYAWGLIANRRRWSAPKTTWPFVPAGASALGRARSGERGILAFSRRIMNLQVIGNPFQGISMMDMSDGKLFVFLYVLRPAPKHADFGHTCPKIPVDLFGDFWYRIGA